MSNLILIITVFCAVFARAGGYQLGNGGDGIYCIRGSQIEIKLLDFYEAEQRKLTIDMGPSSFTYQQKVEYVLKRLEKKDAARAQVLGNLWRQFDKETQFVDDDLVDIPDAGSSRIPAGCAIRQMAIQEEPSLPGDFRYTIDAKLWASADSTTKAGLVLHELQLNEVRSRRSYFGNEHDDTRKVRYFVGWLASSQFEDLTLGQFIDLVKTAKMCTGFSYQGFYVDRDFEFYDSEKTKLKSGRSAGEFHGSCAKSLGVGTPNVQFGFADGQITSAYVLGHLEFDTFSNLTFAQHLLFQNNNLALNTNLGVISLTNNSALTDVSFTKDRKIQRFTTSAPVATNLFSKVYGMTVQKENDKYIVINLTGAQQFRASVHNVVEMADFVGFFPSGKLESFSTHAVEMTVPYAGGAIVSTYYKYDQWGGYCVSGTDGCDPKKLYYSISYFENGYINTIKVQRSGFQIPIRIGNVQFRVSGWRPAQNVHYDVETGISFYPSGYIKSGRSLDRIRGLVNIQGQNVTIPKDNNFVLSENQQIVCFGDNCKE